MCLQREKISFTTSIATSQGQLSLPQTFDAIELNGRQSKVIITDYSFGAHGSVLYTTATVFFAGTIGSRDVLFLHGFADQSHEFALKLSGLGKQLNWPRVVYDSSITPGFTTVAVQSGDAGLLTLWDSDEQLILFSDPTTAGTFWAPAIRAPTPRTVPGLENFWQFGTNTTVLVGGPYLVRNATLEQGTLAVFGDLNASVPLTIVAPTSVSDVTWNGAEISTRSDGRGVLTGRLSLSSAARQVEAPKLGGWKFKDSLPEISADFDDSDWVIADHTSTNITQGMLFGDGRVLYGEYSCLGDKARELTCDRLRLRLVSTTTYIRSAF